MDNNKPTPSNIEACEHNNLIGLEDASWCIRCGSLKLIEKPWMAPSNSVKFQPPVTNAQKPREISEDKLMKLLIHPTSSEVKTGEGLVNAYDWLVSFGQDKIAKAIISEHKKGNLIND